MSTSTRKLARRTRTAIALAATLTVAGSLALTGCSASSASGTKTVAFMVPSTVQSKWVQDYKIFQKELQKDYPDAKTIFYNANASDSTQQSQFETALTRGADVVVLVAVDSTSAAKMVNSAHQSKVPVIAYDHPIKDTNALSLFVGVDGVKQGEITGQWMADNAAAGSRFLFLNGSPTDDNAKAYNKGYHNVLDPLIKQGKFENAGEDWVTGWDPQTAQTDIEQMLTKANDNVNGVIVPWDDGAGVVASALKQQGLTNKVLVTGGDANVAGLQRVLLGTQSMTVLRDDHEESVQSAKAAAALLKSGKVPSSLVNAQVDYGAGKVPTNLLTPKVYTKDNIDELIKIGWVTKADLCNGIPAGTGPC